MWCGRVHSACTHARTYARSNANASYLAIIPGERARVSLLPCVTSLCPTSNPLSHHSPHLASPPLPLPPLTHPTLLSLPLSSHPIRHVRCVVWCVCVCAWVSVHACPVAAGLVIAQILTVYASFCLPFPRTQTHTHTQTYTHGLPLPTSTTLPQTAAITPRHCCHEQVQLHICLRWVNPIGMDV